MPRRHQPALGFWFSPHFFRFCGSILNAALRTSLINNADGDACKYLRDTWKFLVLITYYYSLNRKQTSCWSAVLCSFWWTDVAFWSISSFTSSVPGDVQSQWRLVNLFLLTASNSPLSIFHIETSTHFSHVVNQSSCWKVPSSQLASAFAGLCRDATSGQHFLFSLLLLLYQSISERLQ